MPRTKQKPSKPKIPLRIKGLVIDPTTKPDVDIEGMGNPLEETRGVELSAILPPGSGATARKEMRRRIIRPSDDEEEYQDQSREGGDPLPLDRLFR